MTATSEERGRRQEGDKDSTGMTMIMTTTTRLSSDRINAQNSFQGTRELLTRYLAGRVYTGSVPIHNDIALNLKAFSLCTVSKNRGGEINGLLQLVMPLDELKE